MNIIFRAVPLYFSLSAIVWGGSERFSGVDLWVPTAYQYQFLKLLDAAEKAQAADYCHQLLSGRVLEARSTPEHPIFYFRCRTEERKVFSINVDGITMAVTNTYLERQREKQAKMEAEAQQREMARLAALRDEQKQYWGICRAAIKKRLSLFKGVDILTPVPPAPEIKNETHLRFILAFDALNPVNKALHYKAICDIKGLEDYSVRLKRRIVKRKKDTQ
ncbi:MAG: hypothetical protein KTR20_08855 [Cellvibrionaceae bacterium]|nr:hypothetical protein [Cellvibrionaceae bacterium]